MAKKIFVALLSMAMLAGCASGPELQKYPRTQVERPFTLPKGVATWSIPTAFAVWRNDVGDVNFIPPIPIPLLWEQSLSDSWQLDWSPLPLSARHQIIYDERGFLGITFGVAGGYSSVHGVFLDPLVSVNGRTRLTSNFSINPSVGFQPNFGLKSGEPFTWSTDFELTGLLQLSPLMALTAGPRIWVGDRRYLWRQFYRGTREASSVHVEVPLSAGFLWSFDRQWDFNVLYSLSLIGNELNTWQHLGVIEFKHFW